MNVIVSNKKQQLLSSLNVEIIKELNGEFNVDDLVENFRNFFFQKMILDITALKDYKDIRTVQKLSLSLDMNKVILVLDEDSNTISPEFMSKLISLGIYNFTTNLEGIMYLYNSPNTYRDVAHLHIIETPLVTAVAPEGQTNTVYVDRYVEVAQPVKTNRVIGIKNVTKQTGATTLTYMMKKMLEKYYSVAAIEVEKSDFRFFNDRELLSATNSGIGNLINKNKEKDIILLDINNSENALGLCDEIIYLIEPSMVKLNRLMIVNPQILSNIKGKKVILNQSLLQQKDVTDFEYESGLKIFYNMPPLDERAEYSKELAEFLNKLGFPKIN
ncbi:MAG: hypothetical protein E7157_01145 [Lactobacillales bacterium]|nr:hypothetical protein [Lactobacillales bacterium]